jgi:hypothetical protein
MRYLLTILLAAAATISASGANATPVEEVQARFTQFLAAQNAHDEDRVQSLLADRPEFIWVTRGTLVQGVAAAMVRFHSLYRGTWKLAATGEPQAFVINSRTVQLVAPVRFSVGAPGESASDTSFLLTQLWLRTGNDWRIVSLLPIPISTNSGSPPS